MSTMWVVMALCIYVGENWQTGYRHENSARIAHNVENAENTPHESDPSTAGYPCPPKCYFGSPVYHSSDSSHHPTGPWPPNTYTPFYPSQKVSAHNRPGQGGESPDPSRFYPGTTVEAPPWIHHPRPSLPGIANIPRAPDPFPEGSNVIYAGPGSSETTKPRQQNPLISFVDGSYKVVPSETKDSYPLAHKIHECEPSICTTCGSVKIGNIEPIDAFKAVRVETVNQIKANTVQGDKKSAVESGAEQDFKPPEKYALAGQLKTERVQKQTSKQVVAEQRSVIEGQSTWTPSQVKKDCGDELRAEQAHRSWNTLQGKHSKGAELRGKPVQQAPTTTALDLVPGISRDVQPTVQELKSDQHRDEPPTQLVPAPKMFGLDNQLTNEPVQPTRNTSQDVDQTAAELDQQASFKIFGKQQLPSTTKNPEVEGLAPNSNPQNAVSIKDNAINALLGVLKINQKAKTTYKHKDPISHDATHTDQKPTESTNLKEQEEPMQSSKKENICTSSTSDNGPLEYPWPLSDQWVPEPPLFEVSQGNTEPKITKPSTKTGKRSLRKHKSRTDKHDSKAIQEKTVEDYEFMAANVPQGYVVRDFTNEIQNMKEGTIQDYKDTIKSPFSDPEVVKQNMMKIDIQYLKEGTIQIYKDMTKSPFSAEVLREHVTKIEIQNLKEGTVRDYKDMTESPFSDPEVIRQSIMKNEMQYLKEGTVQDYKDMINSPFWDTTKIKEKVMSAAGTAEETLRIKELMTEISAMKDKVMQHNEAVTERLIQETCAMKSELKREIAALKDKISATGIPSDEIVKIKKDLVKELAKAKDASLQNLALEAKESVKAIAAMKDEIIQKIEATDKAKQHENTPFHEISDSPTSKLANLKGQMREREVEAKTLKIANETVKKTVSLKDDFSEEKSGIKLSERASEEVTRMNELVKEMAAVQGKISAIVERPVTEITEMKEELMKEILAVKDKTKNAETLEKPMKHIALMQNALMKEIAVVKDKTIQNAKLAEKPVKEIATLKEELMKEVAAVKDSTNPNYAIATEKQIETIKEELVRQIAAIKAITTENCTKAAEKPVKEIARMKDELAKEMAAMKASTIKSYAMAREKPINEIAAMKDDLMKQIASIKDKSTENCAKAAEKPAEEVAKMKENFMKEIAEIKENNTKMAERPVKEIAIMRDEITKQIKILGDYGGVAKKKPRMTEISEKNIERDENVQNTKKAGEGAATEKSIPKGLKETMGISEPTTELAPTTQQLMAELESFKERTIENALMASIHMKEIAAINERLSPRKAAVTDNTESTEPNGVAVKTLQQLATDTAIREGSHRPAKHGVKSGDICSQQGQCEIASNHHTASKPGGDSMNKPDFPPKLKRSDPELNQVLKRPGARREAHVKTETEETISRHMPRQTSGTRSPCPTSKGPTNSTKHPPPCFPPINPSPGKRLSTSTGGTTVDQRINPQVPTDAPSLSIGAPTRPPPANPSAEGKVTLAGSKDTPPSPSVQSHLPGHPSNPFTRGQAPDDELITVLKKGVIPIEQSKILDFFSKGSVISTADRSSTKPSITASNPSSNKRPSSLGNKPSPSPDGFSSKPSSSGHTNRKSLNKKRPTKSSRPGIGGSSPVFIIPVSIGSPPKSGNSKPSPIPAEDPDSKQRYAPNRKTCSPTSQSLSILERRRSVTPGGQNVHSCRPSNTAEQSLPVITDPPGSVTINRSSHNSAKRSDAQYTLSGTNIKNARSVVPPSEPTSTESRLPLSRPGKSPSSIGSRSEVTKASEIITTEGGISVDKTFKMDAEPAERDEKGVAKVRYGLPGESPPLLIPIKQDVTKNRANLSSIRSPDVPTPKTAGMPWRASNPSNPKPSEDDHIKRSDNLPKYDSSLLERRDKPKKNQLDLSKPAVEADKPEGPEDKPTGKSLASTTPNLPAVSHRGLPLNPSQRGSSARSLTKQSDQSRVPVTTILLLSRAAENLSIKISKPTFKDSNRKRGRLIETSKSVDLTSNIREATDNLGRPSNTIDITYHEVPPTSDKEELTVSSQAPKPWSENPQQRQSDILSKLASLPALIGGQENKTRQLNASQTDRQHKYPGEVAKFLRECTLGKEKLSACTDNNTVHKMTETSQHMPIKESKDGGNSKIRSRASLPEQLNISPESPASRAATQILTKKQIAEHNQMITKLERQKSAIREGLLKLKHYKEKYRTELPTSLKTQLRALLPNPEEMNRAIAEILSSEKRSQSCIRRIQVTASSFGKDLDRAISEILSAERASQSRQTETPPNSEELSTLSDVERAAAENLSTERNASRHCQSETSTSVKTKQLSTVSITENKSTQITEKASKSSPDTFQAAGGSLAVSQLVEKHGPEELSNRKTQISRPKEYRPRFDLGNNQSEQIHIESSNPNKPQTRKSSALVTPPMIQIPPSENVDKKSQGIPTAKSNPRPDFKGPGAVLPLTFTKTPGKSFHTVASVDRSEIADPYSSQHTLSKDHNPQTKKNYKTKSQSGPPGCPCAERTPLRGNFPGRSDGGSPGDGGSSCKPNDGSLPTKVKEGLNKQVTAEMRAFLEYFKMMAHFGRVDIAYRGIESFFRKQVQEEREHALDIASWTNLRGGDNLLGSVGDNSTPSPESMGCSHTKALAQAVAMEAAVTKSLQKLRDTSESCSDVITSKYLSKIHLREQAKSVDEISRLITNAQRAESSTREMLFFDESLYAKYKHD